MWEENKNRERKKNFEKCILVRYCQIQDRHTAGRKILKFFFYSFSIAEKRITNRENNRKRDSNKK